MIAQQGTVDEYLQKFEDLRALLTMKNPRVAEDFILECSIGGLKEVIRETIKMYEPINLSQAISPAKKQEKVINARERKTKWLHKGSVAPGNKELSKRGVTSLRSQIPLAKSEVKPEFKRIPGACWRCGEGYFPGHAQG